MLRMIASVEDLITLVEEYGFLPFFRNRIEGFSVEEHTPWHLWFNFGTDGPWEWKGPVIAGSGCAYGKFFDGKAGFISREWFPDFANFRRNGYDFEERYKAGLVRYTDKKIYDILKGSTSLISKNWRRLAGITKRSEFDAAVNRLQMLGYVTTVGFEYAKDKSGNTYGFGLARYAVAEYYFGEEFADEIYENEPEESAYEIERHLVQLFPHAQEEQIRRVLGSRSKP